MKIEGIITNAISLLTDLKFEFRLLTADIHRYPDIDAEEIIGIKLMLMNAGVSADLSTGQSERLGELVKPFKDWMFPEDDATELQRALELGDWKTPVVYSKEFDAIGLILSPKKIIDAIMRVPATSHRLFVETDDSIVLTSYYQEECD